jgi:pyruvate dehydrogenase E2 component (dihydrolipoamide acetyltransferase)
MATVVIMPKQGQSVETCIITKWFREKGEKVNSGDILFSYETDKASFDLESPAGGVLLDIFYGDGAEVPVLENVAVIGSEGENTDQFKPGMKEAAALISPEQIIQEEALPTVNQDLKIAGDTKIRISPRAKKLAEEKGCNYKNLKGSGPNGRIITRDIETALSGRTNQEISGTTQAEYTEKPLSSIRKIVAAAMHTSLQNSAQLTHHMSADVRKLLMARASIKENLSSDKDQQDITLNDMICFCVIKALAKFPEANSHFLDDKIRTFNVVNLGLAVDTPRGLMVPAVKKADKMDLVTLSRELKTIAATCKKGNIDPGLIQSTSASFTVSNLGNYGVEMFTPVINLPQVAILGVCTIINRPVDLGYNTFGFVPYMGLSLTYDHRAIDGGPATLFLKEIREQIENFQLK